MKRKDPSVETEFHPTLTDFLFEVDVQYRAWNSELTITSGSESDARHSKTSLHYAKPCCAADIRTWTVGDSADAAIQYRTLLGVRDSYCTHMQIPRNWIDIILESDHIHIEFQPKRQDI